MELTEMQKLWLTLKLLQILKNSAILYVKADNTKALEYKVRPYGFSLDDTSSVRSFFRGQNGKLWP